MKALIAATCVAVLAAVGYYFWSEYSAHKLRTEIAQNNQRARLELQNQAKTTGYNDDVNGYCVSMRTLLDGELKDNDFAKDLVHNCRLLGYL